MISAVVLGAAVLGGVWAGSPYFELIVLLFAAVLAWEWRRLCSGQKFGFAGAVLAIFAIFAVVGMAAGRGDIALGTLAAGTVLLALLGAREKWDRAAWLGGGLLYIGMPCVALVWLRADPEMGRTLIVWLLAVVWAADTGAYLVGRTVGGPKLAPAISPNKTWSGAIGGILCALGVAAVTTAVTTIAKPLSFLLVSGVVAFAAEWGDLLESGIKRYFGVKDAGRIIPGHGGALDRVDGLLLAAPVAGVLVLLERTGYWLWI